jgi:hypothetical protein
MIIFALLTLAPNLGEINVLTLDSSGQLVGKFLQNLTKLICVEIIYKNWLVQTVSTPLQK